MINNQSRSGQAFWLALGNFVSFSFAFVSAAILSRLLTIEEYGTYKQVLYVYSTLLAVFTLGLPRAYSFFLARMPLEQGRKSIEKINFLFLLLGFLFSLLLFFGSDVIADILKNENLSVCLRYFSITPMFLLPVMGLESIMATYRKSSYATVYIILSRLFNLICTVIPVIVWHAGANEAVLGLAISSAICCFIGLFIESIPFKDIPIEKSSLSLISVLKYSLPLLVASLWGVATKSLPQFFISRWYGTDSFAEFSNGFIELPISGMIIGAVATILLPEISRLANSKENTQEILIIWRSSYKKSAMIIFPLAVFACVFATDIILFLYGEKYMGSVFYFQIIIVYNLLRVVPYAPIMMGLNLGKKYAVAMMITTLFTLSLDLIWVYFFNGPHGIAVIQCMAILVSVGTMLYFISKKLRVSFFEMLPIKFSWSIILISLFASVIAYYLNFILLEIELLFIRLVVSGMTFCFIYLGVCRVCKISYKPIFTFLTSKSK